MKTMVKSVGTMWMAAAMVFGAGCMDAPDQLGTAPQALNGASLAMLPGAGAHLGRRVVSSRVSRR